MTDDQQQPNEFPAPKPLPGSVYIRPGIDDRPDYDKVLSPEDKSAVARLAVHQPRRKVEASVTQAETQVAQMTSEYTLSLHDALQIGRASCRERV